jgi:hypothetical protein
VSQNPSPAAEVAPPGEQSIPVPPPDVLEAARRAPGHWLAFVDPTWRGEGEVPVWAIVGEWRSGLDG